MLEKPVAAVIFDMDGVLINSEHLWRVAMMQGFAEVGMSLSEDDCRKTMGMRFSEVVDLWLAHFKPAGVTNQQLQHRVIAILLLLIEKEGHVIDGVYEIISLCKEKKTETGSCYLLVGAPDERGVEKT